MYTLEQAQAVIRARWGLVAALLLTLALYLTTLGYYWMADDFNFAVPKDAAQVLNFFNLGRGNGFYRPLTWLSFVLDYQLWGDNPTMWRLVNLLINLGGVALLWGLVTALAGGRAGTLAALFLAVKPAHPGSITWIDGRFDTLTTLMYLGCVAAFVAYRRSGRRVYYDLALIALLLAILAKEIGLTAPAMLLLADLLFFTPRLPIADGRWQNDKAQLKPQTSNLKPLVLRHAPFIIIGGGYLLMRYVLNAAHLMFMGYGNNFRPGNTIFDNAAGYLGMMLGLPSVAAVQGGAAVALVVGFIVVGGLLAWWAGRLAWFGLAWVFVTLAPVYNIPANDLATRYVYLPSVGLAILLAAVLVRLLRAVLLSHREGLGVGDGRDSLPPSTHPGGRGVVTTVAIIAAILAYDLYATAIHNDEWRVAGEMTRRFVTTLAAQQPTMPPHSRVFLVRVPFSYRRASVLNQGVRTAVMNTYHDYSLQVYPQDYDPAGFTAALRPPSDAASYYFRFQPDGSVQQYQTAEQLLTP